MGNKGTVVGVGLQNVRETRYETRHTALQNCCRGSFAVLLLLAGPRQTVQVKAREPAVSSGCVDAIGAGSTEAAEAETEKEKEKSLDIHTPHDPCAMHTATGHCQRSRGQCDVALNGEGGRPPGSKNKQQTAPPAAAELDPGWDSQGRKASSKKAQPMA